MTQIKTAQKMGTILGNVENQVSLLFERGGSKLDWQTPLVCSVYKLNIGNNFPNIG